jgi:hypothetical protein
MGVFRVAGLPDGAVSAAAEFHAKVLPQVLAELGRTELALTLAFAPADHTQRGWRLAVVQGLAREHAPIRVNGLESDDEAAIAAAAFYLEAAQGVTGQLLALEGNGAGEVLSRAG